MVGPLYPFGFGLSYTEFTYDNLKIRPEQPTADELITITCDITNTGKMAGDEVVQLYIQDEVATVAPFDQVLRGFERVSLEPNEMKTVTFELHAKRDLKMLDRENNWIVEPGVFNVMVGAASDEEGILQRGSFTLR